MYRRKFLILVTVSGSAALTAEGTLLSQKSSSTLAPGCKVFTVEQAKVVEAIADQIVPSDDYPGAVASGVLYFIDGALAGPVDKLRRRFEEGLEVVNRAAREKFGSNFGSLSWDQQTSLLRAVESGDAAGKAGAESFKLIVRLTFQGYYGAPELGGNRNGESWKMLGFSG